MYGRPGSRKSFFGMQMLEATTTGHALLDQFPVRHVGQAIYVQAELTESELRYRFRPMLERSPTAADSIWLPQAIIANVDSRENWQAIETLVQELEPTFAIFDPYSLMLSGNPNEQVDQLRLLKLLNQLRFVYGVTVMVIHHPRKQRFDGAGDAISSGYEDSGGSRAVVEWAGTIMRLARSGHSEKQRLVFEKGRTGDVPDLDLTWDDDAKLFRLPEAPTTRQDGDGIGLDAIPPEGIAAVDWHGRMQAVLGVSRSTTQALLHRLVGQGKVEFVDKAKRVIRRRP